MEKKPTANVVRAWARLVKAQHIALASVEQALKAESMPPLAWYDALLELERASENGLRPFELEREMLLSQYNLSRLLDRIEQAGYVERRPCPEDKRGQRIVITPAGEELRQRMWAVYADAIQRAVGDRLSEDRAEALAGLLGLLIEKTPR